MLTGVARILSIMILDRRVWLSDCILNLFLNVSSQSFHFVIFEFYFFTIVSVGIELSLIPLVQSFIGLCFVYDFLVVW